MRDIVFKFTWMEFEMYIVHIELIHLSILFVHRLLAYCLFAPLILGVKRIPSFAFSFFFFSSDGSHTGTAMFCNCNN